MSRARDFLKRRKAEGDAFEDSRIQMNGQMNFSIDSVPDEIWLMIFKHLSDPNDLVAVLGSCPNFRAIACELRGENLFQAVFPLLLPLVEKKDVHGCARVCRNWRRTVGDTFNALFENERFDPENNSPAKIPLEKYYWHEALKLNNLGSLAEWTNGESVSSEFDIRLKKVDLCVERPDAVWCDAVFQFLRLHGKHILSLTLNLQAHQRHTGYSREFIVDCLGEVPNLKILKIDSERDMNPAAFFDGEERVQRRSLNWSQVNLPRMANLQTVSCLDDSWRFNPFLTQCGHSLSRICLRGTATRFQCILERFPQINDITIFKPDSINLEKKVKIAGPKRRVKIDFGVLFSGTDSSIIELAYVTNAYIIDLQARFYLQIVNNERHWQCNAELPNGDEIESVMMCALNINVGTGLLKQLKSVTHMMFAAYRSSHVTTSFASNQLTMLDRNSIFKDNCSETWKLFREFFNIMSSLKIIHVDSCIKCPRPSIINNDTM